MIDIQTSNWVGLNEVRETGCERSETAVEDLQNKEYGKY